MKRINHLDYTRKGGVITLIVTDEDGGKLDTFKYNRQDRKTEKVIAITLYQKYGVNLDPTIPDEFPKEKGFFDY